MDSNNINQEYAYSLVRVYNSADDISAVFEQDSRRYANDFFEEEVVRFK